MVNRILQTLGVVGACSLLAMPAAQAQTATFDFELVAPPAHTGALVPDGYANATWSGFVLRQTSDFASGGSNGFIVNGTSMALGTDNTPTIRFAAPTVFEGAFVGSNAIGASSSISYTLWLGGTTVASSGLLGFSAGYLPSVYTGAIDKIVFQAANNDRLTLDSIALSPAVPEPQQWALWAAGLGLVAGRQALRRRATRLSAPRPASSMA